MQMHIPNVSRRHIQQNIFDKTIVRTNRPGKLKASTTIQPGDVLYMATHRKEFAPLLWNHQPLPQPEISDIVFETDQYMVINKPPHMSTYPTGPHLFDCATVHLEAMGKGTMHPVHRLDRETSGLLVMAKSSLYAQKLTQLFENHQTRKTYALIAHRPAKNSVFPCSVQQRLGMIEGHIPRQKMHCFAPDRPEGKPSHTDFVHVHSLADHVILLAQPKTGRQHQIRAHAAYLGYPLLGDKMYQQDKNIFTRFSTHTQTQEDYDYMGLARHALHAFHLQLGGDLSKSFQCALAQDMQTWLEDHLDISQEEFLTKMNQAQQTLAAMSPSAI